MRRILYLVCIVLPLAWGTEIAMAFTGAPPHSGPGSVFYGQPEKGGDPLPTQKSQRKPKKQQGSGFRSREVLPKRSQ
jgi:hypothetical protein